MPSSSRALDLGQFLYHLRQYGYLERSAGSSSARSLGPQFPALCQNLISEFLHSLGVEAQSQQRLVTHGSITTSLEKASFAEPHIDHSISRFAALTSSSNLEPSPLHFVQGWTFEDDEWASTSSFTSSSSFFANQPPCRQLSVLRLFPPEEAPTLGLQLRQRQSFYRHWAELPQHFETVGDGLFYKPDFDGSGSESDQVKLDTNDAVSNYELDRDLRALLQDERGVLIERVQNLPLSSLSSLSSSSSSLLSNLGGVADYRLVEVRVDLHRAALAYLVDAFRVWNLYENFTLHKRLAPIKANVVLKKSDARDEAVMSVANYIREWLERKKFPCLVEVIDDDFDDEIERFDDESEDVGGDGKSGLEVDVDPSNDFHSNRNLRALMDKNGVGVPFFIFLDRTMMEHGVLKLYERETRTAEHIHLLMLLPKLVDYLNGEPYECAS